MQKINMKYKYKTKQQPSPHVMFNNLILVKRTNQNKNMLNGIVYV